MEIVQFDPELFTSLEIVNEAFVGLCGLGLVRLRQIDEIRPMG